MTDTQRILGTILEQDKEGLHLRRFGCQCGAAVHRLLALVRSRVRTVSFSRYYRRMTLFWMKMVSASTDRLMLGRLFWMDRPDIKNVVCQLSTHVGTATNRDEDNVKRLLRYLVGNPLCNKIEGCKLDVPAAAGTPLGSVLLMTDTDWAGDVKDHRNYFRTVVWVEGSTMETRFPGYASSKKQNMICQSSGESELMALVDGACVGIATQDQRCRVCGCANGTIVLCTDS